MGMADIAEVLCGTYLSSIPETPAGGTATVFVLSNAMRPMLLYSVLHLTGYPLSIDEIKNFRQFGSKTRSSRARSHLGIETTTGPLGQGFANSVGHGIGPALARGHLQPAGPQQSSIITRTSSRRRLHDGRDFA